MGLEFGRGATADLDILRAAVNTSSIMVGNVPSIMQRGSGAK